MKMRWQAAVGLFLCAHVSYALAAPGLSVLRSFGFADSAGANPCAELIQGSDGALYGTTSAESSASRGTVFRVNKDGTGFVVLKRFGPSPSDGAWPFAAVIEGTDGALYGTTVEGGGSGYGTVFRMSKDGGTFTVLKGFTGNDGAYPEGRLLEASDGALYGTTSGGGTNDYGVVFRLAKDGSGFAVLNYFAGTNGANPEGGLIEGGDGALYGTTYSGGRSNVGSVFRLNKDGSGFTVLKDFVVSSTSLPATSQTNGYAPYGRLIEGTNGMLYGTTSAGGTNSAGTVYTLNKDGTGFSFIRHLGVSKTGNIPDTNGEVPLCELALGSDGMLYGTASSGTRINSNGTRTIYSGAVFRMAQDGSSYAVLTSPDQVRLPAAAVLEGSDGALYGTTQQGGDSGSGTVFKLQKDGTGFTVLKSFCPTGGDGQSPYSTLATASDGALYGTTRGGGTQGMGTIFSLRFDGGAYRLVSSLDALAGASSPVASVVEGLNGALYGNTQSGGAANGTFFRVQKDGTGFTVLFSFTNAVNGQEPRGTLIQASDRAFYGTTVLGGVSSQGTLFRLNADGSGYTVLIHFGSGVAAYPMQALLEASDRLLYGTTYFGGTSNSGVIFKLNKPGSGYTVLKSFGDPLVNGANPMSPLLEASDGMLYGTTYGGGTTNNAGAVFRIKKDGTGFQVLRAFIGIAGDGRHPCGKLVEGFDGSLYGTTERGGTNKDQGTLFKLNKDGSGYAVLASFGGTSGQYPRGGLMVGPDGALYGTTDQGGDLGFGAVFRYGTPVEKISDLQFAGGRASLTCIGLPGTNYWIQRATELGPSATWAPLYSTNAPANGQFGVQDQSPPPGGAFYRLKR